MNKRLKLLQFIANNFSVSMRTEAIVFYHKNYEISSLSARKVRFNADCIDHYDEFDESEDGAVVVSKQSTHLEVHLSDKYFYMEYDATHSYMISFDEKELPMSNPFFRLQELIFLRNLLNGNLEVREYYV
ncbi:MAG: hypothetical protein ABL930_10860 [Pseudobdellovibrio sp.]